MALYDGYIICTSPRSGSTLLCRLLAATRVAGVPESYFHRSSMSGWLEDLGLAPASSTSEVDLLELIFRTAISKGTGDTGIFGLRLQRHSFAFLMEKLRVLFPNCANDVDPFRSAFGRTLFVHLARRDKIAQAISYVKAEQTGLWHAAPDGTELERLSPAQDLVYRARDIQARLDEIIQQDVGWEQWFDLTGIDPFRITYEELSADPIKILGDLLEILGLERKAGDGIEPSVAKLADDTNQTWAARFRMG